MPNGPIDPRRVDALQSVDIRVVFSRVTKPHRRNRGRDGGDKSRKETQEKASWWWWSAELEGASGVSSAVTLLAAGL